MTVRVGTARWIAISALALALTVTAAIVMGGGASSYVINAQFEDAGQLIPGNLVEVAGRTIGSVSRISLTPDGLADVTLAITDSPYTPLHVGTIASIRAVGQAGLTNRYVDINPGPGFAPAIPNGGTLGVDHTNGIVDVDALLDAFDPRDRASLRALIDHSAEMFSGSGARYFNATLARLSPALEETSGWSEQLIRDRAGLRQLIRTAAAAATAIASRHSDLENAVASTAAAFGAIASQQAALSDALARLPDVLPQATRTLTLARGALMATRPMLRALPAVAPPLTLVLHRTADLARRLAPVSEQLLALLPGIDASLTGFAPLAPVADGAFAATAAMIRSEMPIYIGLRQYSLDLAIGVFGGLAGIAAAPYDQIGHYIRLEYLESPQAPGGLLQALVPPGDLVPGELALRTGAVAPCPGGAAPPAADHSNPWILGRSICNPANDHP